MVFSFYNRWYHFLLWSVPLNIITLDEKVEDKYASINHLAFYVPFKSKNKSILIAFLFKAKEKYEDFQGK